MKAPAYRTKTELLNMTPRALNGSAQLNKSMNVTHSCLEYIPHLPPAPTQTSVETEPGLNSFPDPSYHLPLCSASPPPDKLNAPSFYVPLSKPHDVPYWTPSVPSLITLSSEPFLSGFYCGEIYVT